jgi:uncharacterized protein
MTANSSGMRDKLNAPTPTHDERLVIEDTRAWLTQVVIGLGLCPFAKAVHLKSQIRYSVCWSKEPEGFLWALEEELLHLQSSTPQLTQTTLLMAPFAVPDFLDFNQLIHEAQKMLKRLKMRDLFQLAHFHPEYQFAGTLPHEPENLSNRAPYPTLHILRVEAVEAAIDAHPDVESIYVNNQRLFKGMGFKGYEALGLQTRVKAPSSTS